MIVGIKTVAINFASELLVDISLVLTAVIVGNSIIEEGLEEFGELLKLLTSIIVFIIAVCRAILFVKKNFLNSKDEDK